MLLSNNLISQVYLTEDWIQTSGIPDTIDYSACKVDGSGNVYVTTNTISATEKANGSTSTYDGIICRIDASGFVVWNTYLGGQNGHTTITGAALDNEDNLYICGGTMGGTLFPIEDPGGSAYVENTGNAFVSIFANNNELLWSTRFGAESGDVSTERATDITVFEGTIGIVERTDEDGFEPMGIAYQDTYGGGLTDGFLIRFNVDYSDDWSTYIGLEQKDYLRTITHNLEGDYFIGGNSFGSAPFITRSNCGLECNECNISTGFSWTYR